MTAMTPSSTIRSARWATPVHLTGSALLGFIGLAHLLGLHVFNGNDSPAEEVVNELSAQVSTSMFDGSRQVTVFGLNTGYSVGMGLLALLFGLLAIVAVRAAPQLIARWSLFNAICLAAAGGMFWIACLYFPELAIVASGLATLCFAAVLVAGNRRTA
ncbi:LIC_13387 family protein [Nocardia iowensis]|uniref:Uncharacterized protein n=1 Tax=Nocardia iowensis TaxID=204891 RepID=A0ABX8RT19_NOCIO|nr:hypothetical protein [Nocardia iowensis]QXN92785.1 hypothetical protein KV110_06570 [Nocardia iowensis]